MAGEMPSDAPLPTDVREMDGSSSGSESREVREDSDPVSPSEFRDAREDAGEREARCSAADALWLAGV